MERTPRTLDDSTDSVNGGAAVHIDPLIAATGFAVGVVVGLTGMGGGALMTPLLVLLFKIQPLAAVSSDLVAAFVMKPVGAGVHLRRGTVHLDLVKWLVIGSVPAAFSGVLLLKALGDGDVVQDRIKLLLGVALLVAATSILAKQQVASRRAAATIPRTPPTARPLATALVGVVGGLVVGLSSVGSGSLMIVLLLMLYPQLSARELVGTDLVQAIPLVGSAALGHLLFGDFRLGVTASLLLGSLPGVYLGARVSSRAPDAVIRPILVLVLTLSGLKLLGASNALVGGCIAITAVVAAAVVLRRRRTHAMVEASVASRTS
ncbi:MAG: uncharacterized protein QOD30_469 [Actinomycetota bacterium]|nr:uncharacterized protein [Actinomycetota bacterium]